jgi:hypothetical protein
VQLLKALIHHFRLVLRLNDRFFINYLLTHLFDL